MCVSLFFFNDTATTEIYTLSLHDALPIWLSLTYSRATAVSWTGWYAVPQPSHVNIFSTSWVPLLLRGCPRIMGRLRGAADRKSTRLNSSHANISYAVFCLKKKKS